MACKMDYARVRVRNSSPECLRLLSMLVQSVGLEISRPYVEGAVEPKRSASFAVVPILVVLSAVDAK